MFLYVNFKNEKAFRLLDIYERLMKGEILSKKDLAHCYSVSEKTIQRDISDLRTYLVETRFSRDEMNIYYNKKINGYQLQKNIDLALNSTEIIALCKLIICSKAFSGQESQKLISKLTNLCASAYRREVEELVLTHFYTSEDETKKIPLLRKCSEMMHVHRPVLLTYKVKKYQYQKEIIIDDICFDDYHFYIYGYELQTNTYYVIELSQIVQMKERLQTQIGYGKHLSKKVNSLTNQIIQYQGDEELLYDKYPTAIEISEKEYSIKKAI